MLFVMNWHLVSFLNAARYYQYLSVSDGTMNDLLRNVMLHATQDRNVLSRLYIQCRTVDEDGLWSPPEIPDPAN